MLRAAEAAPPLHKSRLFVRPRPRLPRVVFEPLFQESYEITTLLSNFCITASSPSIPRKLERSLSAQSVRRHWTLGTRCTWYATTRPTTTVIGKAQSERKVGAPRMLPFWKRREMGCFSFPLSFQDHHRTQDLHLACSRRVVRRELEQRRRVLQSRVPDR